MSLMKEGAAEAPLDELDRLQELHTMTRRPPADSTNRLADNAAAAALGNRLFHDPALSGCGTVSCASCYRKEEGGTVHTPPRDGLQRHHRPGTTTAQGRRER